MDLTEIREFETQQVGTPRLSQIVRRLGYSDPMDYRECVIGRAYTFMTGRDLQSDGCDYDDAHPNSDRPFLAHAAEQMGIPQPVLDEAENMCIRHKPASAIADWLESIGY